MEKESETEFMTTTEAAKELGLSHSMVHKLIREKKLDVVRESGPGRQRDKIKIPRSAIQHYIETIQKK